MKKNVFVVVIAVSMMIFSACRSNKQATVQTQPMFPGIVEVEMPCVQYSYDTDEFFAGMGIGENINAQNARNAALAEAQRMIHAKIGGLAKGLSTDYSRVMNGNAQQHDVQGVVESEITKVVDRMLDDAKSVCEKLYRTPAGSYQSHIAIQISKKEIARQVASALSENQKLETLYNREQFRKWAEDYMKNYEANK